MFRDNFCIVELIEFLHNIWFYFKKVNLVQGCHILKINLSVSYRYLKETTLHLVMDGPRPPIVVEVGL